MKGSRLDGVSRSMMERTWDVIVIGSGIVGAACAVACSREGLRVAVVEAGEIGGGATAEGMGHLVVMDDSDAQLNLSARSRQLWDELAETLPAGADFSRSGTIWVAADADELALVAPKAAAYAARGIRAEMLDADRLYELEANLRPDLAGGLYVPDDAVVYPPVVCRWYLDEICAAGGAVVRQRVERIDVGGVVKLANGETLTAATVVNAAGVYAGKLTPNLPVRYKKGHLVITDRYPGFVTRQLIELGYLKKAHDSDGDSVAFNVQPRPTGQLLIGSSRQYDAEDRAVDRKILGEMIDAAVAYLPGLAALQALRCWTGFRAATPDNLPLVGPVPEQDGVLLATGHEGLGITTSLATAELIVAAITGKPTALDPEPYLPGRFAA